MKKLTTRELDDLENGIRQTDAINNKEKKRKKKKLNHIYKKESE